MKRRPAKETACYAIINQRIEKNKSAVIIRINRKAGKKRRKKRNPEPQGTLAIGSEARARLSEKRLRISNSRL